MIRVKDIDGNIIPGLVKNGISLIVDSNEEYIKYKKDKEMVLEIKQLKGDMSEIKSMLNKLLLNSTNTQGKING